MKRSPAPAPLSRGHHHALHAAVPLRRATAGDVGDRVRHFPAFWHGDCRRRFGLSSC